MRGNVIDLAVGVVIGGAFGKIVSSLVDNIIMPFVGLLTGGIDFSKWAWTLREASVDAAGMAPRMSALRTVGVPYTDEQIAAAAEEVKGKTELEALIAYLQSMGRALK